MTDQPETETEAPEQDGSRLDRLEATQQEQGSALERIEQALARIIPGSHAEAEQRTERRLDRGSAVAAEVKAELEKAKREQAEREAAEADKSEREQIKEQLAQLREAPPAPPPRPLLARIGTAGWHDR